MDNKLMRFILCLIFVFSINLNAQEKVKFGFLTNFELLNNFGDARETLATWIEGIGEKRQITVDIEFYDDANLLYNDYISGKVNMIILDYGTFFKYKKEIDNISNNFWSLSYSENRNLNYCLISQNKLSIDNLKNSTVSLKNIFDLSTIWFDKKSLEYYNKTYTNLVKNILHENKESTLLLNVFFGKSDFAVIRKSTWNTMLELNPGISKKVEILECSKTNFTPFIGFFSNRTDEKQIELFFNLSKNLNTYDDGKEMFSIFNFNHIYRLENEQIQNIENFFTKYNSLKSKFK